jgi:hypothetical protein
MYSTEVCYIVNDLYTAGTGSSAQPLVQTSEIEILLLANHVEAVNGLLYVSGGGWTDHVRTFPSGGSPPLSRLGIGISVLVPWNETNQPHSLAVTVENEDASVTLAQVDAQLSVGRPPQLALGAEQHVVLALTVDLVFPTAGGYRVVARLNHNRSVKAWPFRVHDQAGSTAGSRPPG